MKNDKQLQRCVHKQRNISGLKNILTRYVHVEYWQSIQIVLVKCLKIRYRINTCNKQQLPEIQVSANIENISPSATSTLSATAKPVKTMKTIFKEIVEKDRKNHPMLGWYLLQVAGYSFMVTLVLLYAIIVLIAKVKG